MAGDLGQRVGVAVVGIPAVLALTYLGSWFMAVPLAAFAAWGAHEVFRMAERREVRPAQPIGCALAAAFVLLAAWRPAWTSFAPWALGVLAVGTLLAILESIRVRGPSGHPLAAAAVTVFGALYVGLGLSFALLLHALPSLHGWVDSHDTRVAGLVVVALPLAATWIGDAAAYFAGSAWGRGRARLAPVISPNKSWVGFWAALVAAAVAAGLWGLPAARALPSFGGDVLPWLPGVGAALGLAAVMGDLAESLLKREAGVKDSGTFFPGHGGVLDRIDSLILTVPTAYVALVLLEMAS